MKWKSVHNLGSPAHDIEKNTKIHRQSESDDNLRGSTLSVPQEQRRNIASILFGGDLKLLVMICQTSLVGDAAASMSGTIVQMLKEYRSLGATEKFIEQVLRTKLVIYTSKGRKLTDFLRDNSMSTMVVTAFARSVGSTFIRETLTQPLTDLAKLIKETKASKVSPEAPLTLSSPKLAFTVSEQETMLLSSCASIFQTILAKKDAIPLEICQICAFVKRETETMIRKNQRFRPKLESTADEEAEQSLTNLPETPGNKSSSVLEIPPGTPKTRSDMSGKVSETEDSSKRPKSAAGPPSISSPEQERSLRSLHSENSLADTLSVNELDLTLPERLVGALLMLRFIVPAVTAPDNNNIQVGVNSSSIRKELIQCGKILNGFCSEADFSQKEPNLTQVNEFLLKNKNDFKVFVNSVCAAGSPRAESSAVASGTSPEADDHLIIHLTRSLNKIEEELPKILGYLPPADNALVLHDLQKLKSILQSVTKNTPTARKQTLMQRISMKLGRLFSPLSRKASAPVQPSPTPPSSSSPSKFRSVSFNSSPR